MPSNSCTIARSCVDACGPRLSTVPVHPHSPPWLTSAGVHSSVKLIVGLAALPDDAPSYEHADCHERGQTESDRSSPPLHLPPPQSHGATTPLADASARHGIRE